MGLIYHLRGDLEQAKRVYERGADNAGARRDQALLLSWRATVDWLQGESDASRDRACRALEIATAVDDAQALAAAHTVLAMLAALTGDRGANDAHYVRALHHAERAGDVLQQIRIRTNRGSLHLEEGAYKDALAELDIALRLSDLTGFQFYRALALTNRGEARFALGRLEEAVADLNAARTLYQRLGSQMVSYPLLRLGDVFRERGSLALARAAYEEALERSRAARDMQVLVPALAGLARVLAEEQPDQAQRLIEQALPERPSMAQVAALLAQGWVALAGSRRGVAGEAARAAASAARARRDRPGLAEALELEALATSDQTLAARRLEEAAAIWRELGTPIAQARTELARGLLTPGPTGASRAQQAKDQLRALGVRALPPSLASLATHASPSRIADVAIESLGTFRVLRQGEPVPLREWQSRKARDLLKILVARRGRATPREVLMEELWPEEDPLKVANRLSVALSIVRAVLDPDKRFNPDQFIISDKSTVALSLGHLDVDVEHFANDAAAGITAMQVGRRQEAMDRLAAAADRYVGDFLEEDIYEDWAQSLRDEMRTTFIRVSRALAEHAADAGDHDAAERHLLRIIERDQYDEPAHLRLVSVLLAARRHGEARRRFRVYTARMAELGIEPATFAGPL